MAVKSGKNSLSVARFRAALTDILATSGQTRKEFARSLGIPYSTITSVLNGSVPASIALMDEFAEKTHRELSDILTQGRAILAGTDPDQSTDQAEPPEFSPEQQAAIEAFKTCLKIGGDIPKMLARTAIEHVKEKEIEAGFQNPTPKRYSKSA